MNLNYINNLILVCQIIAPLVGAMLAFLRHAAGIGSIKQCETDSGTFSQLEINPNMIFSRYGLWLKSKFDQHEAMVFAVTATLSTEQEKMQYKAANPNIWRAFGACGACTVPWAAVVVLVFKSLVFGTSWLAPIEFGLFWAAIEISHNYTINQKTK